MSKNILILSASPRKGGNSDLLCDAFAQGAKEAGHTIEKFYVQDQKIGGCMACYVCRGKGVCVQKDDTTTVEPGRRPLTVTVPSVPVVYRPISSPLAYFTVKVVLGMGFPVTESTFESVREHRGVL